MKFDQILEVENKQRLNLSDRAIAILLEDMGVFEENDAPRLTSGFINRVFRCYREGAESTLSVLLDKKRQELTSLFAGLLPESRNQALERCLAAYEKQLTAHRDERMAKKGTSVLIRIDDANVDFFTTREAEKESVYHQNNVGHYIKVVLEEYCELPYIKRERVYYSDKVKTIEYAIGQNKILRIKMRSKRHEGSEHNVCYMKPLCIQEDKAYMYNYVVGMLRSGPEEPWAIGSVRLSSILACKDLAESGHISGEEKKHIFKEISQKGVQYLSDNQGLMRVVVEFNPYGEKMYQQILHMRPLYIKRTGRVYEFECARYQAETYFFKFGSRVKILEPQSMADDFKKWYLAAAKVYE